MRSLLIVMLSLIVTVSCSKKKEHCSQAVYRIPGYGAFIGFNADDVDTVLIEKYHPGTGFTRLADLDTVYITQPVFNGDTLLRDRLRGILFTVSYGGDYRIVLPGINRSFEVTDVTYGAPVVEWEEEVCHGRTFVEAPYKVTIDGQVTNTHVLMHNNNYFYLK